jgi:hypothetical protein
MTELLTVDDTTGALGIQTTNDSTPPDCSTTSFAHSSPWRIVVQDAP